MPIYIATEWMFFLCVSENYEKHFFFTFYPDVRLSPQGNFMRCLQQPKDCKTSHLALVYYLVQNHFFMVSLQPDFAWVILILPSYFCCSRIEF